MEGTLVIPDGLTFVTGSGKLEDGIKTTLGWDSVEWTPVPNMILNGFGSESFTGTDKLAVMKFQCTVDNDATAKDYEVTLIELVADDENYETKNPTCIPATITVSAAPVAVTGVTIDETLSVNIGQTKTPSFTVAPAEATNKTVSFTSDNPAVATVNATTGEVTGVSKGTATITVKTADGNFTDTCTVTVSCAHVFDKEVATEAYKASDATCTAKATYYKSCACGEKGTATFEYGELADHNWTPATCTAPKTCSVCHATEGDPLGHTEGTEWKSDKDNHWHTCTVAGCGVVIESSKAAHTPDREAATETDPIKCSVCDYIITPALGMQDYIVEMPVSIAVKLTGDKKPAKETFKFEIYDLGVEDAEFEIVKDSITVENLEFDENGVAFIEGIIKIKVTGEEQLNNLTEGFSVRMVKGSTKGWTYASEQWRIEPFFENDALDLKIAVKEIVDGEISEEYANCMSFAVSYEAVSEPDPTDPTDPVEPTDPSKPEEPIKPTESNPDTGAPDSPQTGDNSMMALWIALLFVSGVGVVGTTIYSRKKKYTVK